MDKAFVLRLNSKDYEEIKKLADKDDRSVNYFINKLIKKELEKQSKKGD